MANAKYNEDIREIWTENNRYKKILIKEDLVSETSKEQAAPKLTKPIDPMQYSDKSSSIVFRGIIYSFQKSGIVSLQKLESAIEEYNTLGRWTNEYADRRKFLKELTVPVNSAIKEHYCELFSSCENPVYTIFEKGGIPCIQVKYRKLKGYPLYGKADMGFVVTTDLPDVMRCFASSTFDSYTFYCEIDELMDLVVKRHHTSHVPFEDKPSNAKTIAQFQKILDYIIFVPKDNGKMGNRFYISSQDLRYFELAVVTVSARPKSYVYSFASKSTIVKLVSNIVYDAIARVKFN